MADPKLGLVVLSYTGIQSRLRAYLPPLDATETLATLDAKVHRLFADIWKTKKWIYESKEVLSETADTEADLSEYTPQAREAYELAEVAFKEGDSQAALEAIKSACELVTTAQRESIKIVSEQAETEDRLTDIRLHMAEIERKLVEFAPHLKDAKGAFVSQLAASIHQFIQLLRVSDAPFTQAAATELGRRLNRALEPTEIRERFVRYLADARQTFFEIEDEIRPLREERDQLMTSLEELRGALNQSFAQLTVQLGHMSIEVKMPDPFASGWLETLRVMVGALGAIFDPFREIEELTTRQRQLDHQIDRLEKKRQRARELLEAFEVLEPLIGQIFGRGPVPRAIGWVRRRHGQWRMVTFGVSKTQPPVLSPESVVEEIREPVPSKASPSSPEEEPQFRPGPPRSQPDEEGCEPAADIVAPAPSIEVELVETNEFWKTLARKFRQPLKGHQRTQVGRLRAMSVRGVLYTSQSANRLMAYATQREERRIKYCDFDRRLFAADVNVFTFMDRLAQLPPSQAEDGLVTFVIESIDDHSKEFETEVRSFVQAVLRGIKDEWMLLGEEGEFPYEEISNEIIDSMEEADRTWKKGIGF